MACRASTLTSYNSANASRGENTRLLSDEEEALRARKTIRGQLLVNDLQVPDVLDDVYTVCVEQMQYKRGQGKTHSWTAEKRKRAG